MEGAAREANDVAGADRLAFAHPDRGEERVRRAQPVGVQDGDEQGARHQPGEHDLAVGRGGDGFGGTGP